MTPRTKKILWVVVPMGVATAIFAAWYFLSNKTKKVYVSPANPATTPPKSVLPASKSTTGQFPLQVGSRNGYVKTLQTALGVTADGIFGPITLGALQAQFGTSTVADQNALTSIVNASAQAAQVTAMAQTIYNQFTAGGYDIQVNTTTTAEGVDEDSSGNLNPTGAGFTMTAGEVYDGTVFTLSGSTQLGKLILNVLPASTLQGEYTLDPSAVTLVLHNSGGSAAGITPTVNPATGMTSF